jgi:hypothetical protein
MLLPAVLLAVAGLGPWVIAEVKLKVSGSSDSSAARKRSGATLCSPSWNLPAALSDFPLSGTCTSRQDLFPRSSPGTGQSVAGDRRDSDKQDRLILFSFGLSGGLD